MINFSSCLLSLILIGIKQIAKFSNIQCSTEAPDKCLGQGQEIINTNIETEKKNLHRRNDLIKENKRKSE